MVHLKLNLLGVCLMANALVLAQSSSELNIGNIKLTVNANGILGTDLTTLEPACVVPAGSNINAMFSAGLWVGGKTPDNTLHLAAQQYETSQGGDYWPGPLTVDGNATITMQESQAYDEIWTVYSSDVMLHRAYHDCVEDPNCDAMMDFPGYQPPVYFNTWPAHGDVGANQAEYLAPFFDRDQDGVYDPVQGDHPCVPGDEAKYFIFNDQKAHQHSGAASIGLEVHALVYAYATSDADIDNTVFVHYRLINRSSQSITEAYAGLFADFDLGNFADDYVGYDVQRSLSYVYNADNNDEDLYSLGYGPQPPAFGAVVFEGPFLPNDGLDTAPNDLVDATGTGFNDGEVDNERYGPSSAAYMAGNSLTGTPSTAVQMYNRISGLWNDGSEMLYSGTGHISDGNADPNTPISFSFPNASDPAGLATNGVLQTPWSEMSAGNFPDDRKMLTSMGPFEMSPGEVHEIDMAFCYARANSGGPFSSVQELQTRADAIRTFYADLEDPCGWSLHTGVLQQELTQKLKVYPSPAAGLIHLEIPSGFSGTPFNIIDLTGRVVKTGRMTSGTMRLDITQLNSGIYAIEAQANGVTYLGRVIKK